MCWCPENFEKSPGEHKKCKKFFWSVFSQIRTEYGEILRYSVRMRENTDQKNSKYGHFSHSKCQH